MTRRALLKNLALALFSLPWLPKILGAQEPDPFEIPPSVLDLTAEIERTADLLRAHLANLAPSPGNTLTEIQLRYPL